MVSRAESKPPTCRRAASVHPPTSRTGAAADDARPHHGTAPHGGLVTSRGRPSRWARRAPPSWRSARTEPHQGRASATSLPAMSASPEPEPRRAAPATRGGTNENISPRRSRSARGVHPHQHQVVALGDHVLVHLLRPLGRDQQVRARTCGPRAAIRTACSVASAFSASSGLCRADVVRLVDHDQHRLARRPPAPQRGRAPPRRPRPAPRGWPASRGRRPRSARRRARRAPAANRRSAARPDLPADDAEVLRTRPSARSGSALARIRPTPPSTAACPRASVDAARAAPPYSSRSATGSRRSTAACARRPSSPKRTRSGSPPADTARRTSTPPAAPRTAGRPPVRVGAHLAEPDVVGVQVEDDDAQAGLQQQPLEHQAE